MQTQYQISSTFVYYAPTYAQISDGNL